MSPEPKAFDHLSNIPYIHSKRGGLHLHYDEDEERHKVTYSTHVQMQHRMPISIGPAYLVEEVCPVCTYKSHQSVNGKWQCPFADRVRVMMSTKTKWNLQKHF